MSQYIARRLLITIPLLIGVSIITFVLINLAPGDPITVLIPREELYKMSQAQIDELRHQFGLDKPLYVRYFYWMRDLVLHGSLGYSIVYRRPVLEILFERLPATLLLMSLAMLVQVVIGIALGVFSALKQYSLPDYVLTVLAFVGISLPSFYIALLILFVFAVNLRTLPLSGMWTPGEPTGLNLDLLRHLAMPVLSLSLAGVSTYLRYARASMLDVLGMDYVTVARAKGLGEQAVVLRHVFRNALLPLVTIVGLSLPGLLTGAFFIEYIFTWPGMGSLAVEALGTRDYPMQMGVAMLSALLVLLANLVTDLAYAVVDPRVSYG